MMVDMSLSVCVMVDRSAVLREAWRRLYDETRTVLRRWPDPPVTRRVRRIAGVDLAVYTREVEDARGWGVCGDARSRLHNETSELPREYGVPESRPPTADIVRRAIVEDDDTLDVLLGANTRGRPYHTLVTAIAMLVEHRLPHAAVARGDLDPEDARRAQDRLREILEEVVPLPLVLDADRLRHRLSSCAAGPDIEEAIDRVSPPSSVADAITADLLGALSRVPGRIPYDELEAAVACENVDALTVSARHLIEAFVEQAMHTARRHEIGPKLDASGEDLHPAIARGAAATSLVLTETAWEEIEHADTAERQLLAVLAMLEPVALAGSLARRAVFESAAIRRSVAHRSCVAWSRP